MISILIFIYTIYFAYLKENIKFENSDSNRSREICDRNFYWRERKWTKKGLIRNMWLFFATQYNSSLSSFVPNFRIITQVVIENFLTEKMSICIYKSHRRKKMKNWKKKTKCGLASEFLFTQYSLPTLRCTQNFKILALIGAKKSVTEISIGEKEKKNK